MLTQNQVWQTLLGRARLVSIFALWAIRFLSPLLSSALVADDMEANGLVTFQENIF